MVRTEGAWGVAAALAVGSGSVGVGLLDMDASSSAWRWFSICFCGSIICCSIRKMCSAKSCVVIVCCPLCPYEIEAVPAAEPVPWGKPALSITWPRIGRTIGAKAPKGDVELKAVAGEVFGSGVTATGVTLVPRAGVAILISAPEVASAANYGFKFLATG